MKKVILLIIDGFGIRDSENGNAIKMSSLPNITEIMNKYSVSKLSCDAESVGLPRNVVGNSETGHIILGSGRIVKQPYTIINESIIDKTFFENDHLLDMMDHVKDNKSKLHLIGLLSCSGSHSSIEHFYAVLALARKCGVENVVFHFITDGCDEANTAAIEHMNSFMEKAKKLGIGIVGTISGRYYAMNSDGNYDRVKKAYDALVYGIGNTFADYQRCLDLHYKNNITDEYINPSIITKGSNTFYVESMGTQATISRQLDLKAKQDLLSNSYEVDLGIECCDRSKEALAANEDPSCDCRVCRLFVKKEN